MLLDQGVPQCDEFGIRHRLLACRGEQRHQAVDKVLAGGCTDELVDDLVVGKLGWITEYRLFLRCEVVEERARRDVGETTRLVDGYAIESTVLH
ncbi:MAG: hypothetical protein ABL886_06595 [Rhodoglobus sp.]